MKKHLLTFSLTCAMLLGMTSLSSAATLLVSADSTVFSGDPNSNFGLDNAVFAFDGNNDPNNISKGYLKFDASSLTGQVIDSISGLTMRYTLSVNRTGNFFFLDGTGADTWAETGITWNNAPLNNTSDNDFSAGAGQTLTSLGSITGNGQFQPITLTFGASEEAALINALNTGDRIATIAFNHTGTNGFQINSLQSGNGSFLTYTAIPEPTSAALLLAAGLTLCIRRRRCS